MSSYREVATYMLDNVITNDLFPAGFTPNLFSYYYGNYDYSTSRAIRRFVKRGLLRKRTLINRMNKEVFYYYYK